MQKDPLLREALGDHVFQKYIEAKENEWQRFATTVTQWELQEYLGKF